jgi:ankyrin repeat protein
MTRTKLLSIVLLPSLMIGCAAPANQNSQPSNQQANSNQAYPLGAGVIDEQGTPELKKAIDNHQDDHAKQLIESGIDVNAGNRDGVTPLMNAAGFGKKELVELLIKRGADVNAKTRSSYTALMSAAMSGQTEIITILLDAGADPTVKDTVTGKSAADIAIEKDHKELAQMLISRGAPVKK